jgi:hypothetical protein
MNEEPVAPSKSPRWKQWAATIGGALFGAVGGLVSLFFGLSLVNMIVPNTASGFVFLSVFYAPLVIWVSAWGVLTYINRGQDSFRFFSGGIIGVMIFLLIHGLCVANLKIGR